MAQVITAKEAAALIPEGSRVMVAGFIACGAPEKILTELKELGTKNLTCIAIAADRENTGSGMLISNGQVKRFEASHIGTNPVAQKLYTDKTMEIEFIPQGTLMERMHAKASGLGGILTPVGVGTSVEEGKQVIEVDGKKFLLETPLGADFALLKAKKADKLGNLVFSKTARNCNPLMAMASDISIVQVDEIVEPGEIDPEEVIVPGIFVKYLVKA